MSKILSVALNSVPEHIHVGDHVNDITVVTKIEFHPLDIQLEMAYCLHLFVFDVHGSVDAPLFIPNWDESWVFPIPIERKDDFLGKKAVFLKATEQEMTIDTPMPLTLGQFDRDRSYMSRKLRVFASLIPAVGRAAKWSEPFTSHIAY
jgi:hypothetical protein